MDVTEIGHNYGRAKASNKYAFLAMLKAKQIMLKLKLLSLFNTDIMPFSDMIDELDKIVNRNFKELFMDRRLLKAFYKIIKCAINSGYQEFQDDFGELIHIIENKDINITMWFSQEFETSCYAMRGINMITPNAVSDMVTDYNQELEKGLVKLKLLD